MRRIHVDFNDMTIDGTGVYISEHVNPDFTEFQSGEKVIVYMPFELEAEATLQKEVLDDGREVWFTIADWSTIRYLD